MDFKCDELILGKKDADSRALTIPGGSMAASLPPAVGSIGYLAFADGWVFFVEYFVYFRIEAPLHQFTYL